MYYSKIFVSSVKIFPYLPNFPRTATNCFHSSSSFLFQAKIIGVYKVGLKTSTSSLKLDVLVMENLFFGRDIADRYDLKGSIRNRLAYKSQGRTEEEES